MKSEGDNSLLSCRFANHVTNRGNKRQDHPESAYLSGIFLVTMKLLAGIALLLSVLALSSAEKLLGVPLHRHKTVRHPLTAELQWGGPAEEVVPQRCPSQSPQQLHGCKHPTSSNCLPPSPKLPSVLKCVSIPQAQYFGPISLGTSPELRRVRIPILQPVGALQEMQVTNKSMSVTYIFYVQNKLLTCEEMTIIMGMQITYGVSSNTINSS
ncbi:hypothetical protein CEXT_276561 [Caerostris extrusa]|uniref:Uncharacterized protein n=1 Tax=Caerostris extrusa TaxID=172846 RepID=A0AAV4X1N2_CAEEX|nr:hypothetical protein CEXT_276561 [Caerostris extrusa]